MSAPFGDHAAEYWAAGLPVIPLRVKDKRPAITGWSRYCTEMPSAETQAQWLATFGDGNIGLTLGPQSGLIAIDIDTPDPALQKVIMDLLPPTPWVRIGAKGMVLIYRYTHAHAKKFKIAYANGTCIVEMLTTGQQIVLPPSIHPTTGLAYTENASLVEMAAQAPVIVADIEARLRVALQEHVGERLSIAGHSKATDFVSTGSRMTAMQSMASLCAIDVLRGRVTFLETVEILRQWAEMRVEKVAGDDVEVTDGVQLLVKFLVKDVTGEKKRALPLGWDKGLDRTQKEQLGLSFDEEHVEWAYEKIISKLKEDFALNSEEKDAPKRRDLVDKTLDRMARSKSLDELDEAALLRFISKESALGFTVTELKKRLSRLRQDGLVGTDHTEIARAVVKDFDGLCNDGSKFWRWGGDHWGEVEEAELLGHVAENYGALPAAKKQNDHRQVVKVVAAIARGKLAKTETRGINFANGFLTHDLVLLPHSPDFGATYVMPIRYLPNAEEPVRFLQMLRMCWQGEPDMEARIDTIQEAMCVTLFGDAPSYQRAILLYGLAATGKSQLLNIVEALMPMGTTSAVSAEQLGDDKFMAAQLVGKLLNLGGEMPESKPINGQMFKLITTGDPVEVQFKHERAFKTKLRCAHWFAGNHLPKSGDTSEGFIRRWLIFTFNRVVPIAERTLDLGAEIAAEEREQIVAWAIRARTRLDVNKRYTRMPSHDIAEEQMAETNDSVRRFINQSPQVKIVPDWASSMTAVALHQAYTNYFAGQPVRVVSFGTFLGRLNNLAERKGFKVTPVVDTEGREEVILQGLKWLEPKRTADRMVR